MVQTVLNPNWSKLVETDPNWYTLVQTGTNWYKLVQTGTNWSKPVQTGPNWLMARLERARGGVFFLVALRLAVYVDVDFAVGVDDGADPTTLHKVRCHMVDGRSCRSSHDSFLSEISSPNRVHESTAEA